MLTEPLTQVGRRIERDTESDADIVGVQDELERAAGDEVFRSSRFDLRPTPDHGARVGLGRTHHGDQNSRGRLERFDEERRSCVGSRGLDAVPRIAVELPRRQEERWREDCVDGVVGGLGATPLDGAGGNGPVAIGSAPPRAGNETRQLLKILTGEDHRRMVRESTRNGTSGKLC